MTRAEAVSAFGRKFPPHARKASGTQGIMRLKRDRTTLYNNWSHLFVRDFFHKLDSNIYITWIKGCSGFVLRKGSNDEVN